MKRRIVLLLLLVLSFGSGFFVASKNPFSRKDIGSAQKLIGLQFSKGDVDTMFSYLERNLTGYEAMRNLRLPETVVPPLLFTTNYRVGSKEQHKKIEWSVEANPDAVSEEELAFFSVEQLAALIKAKKVSSVELTQLFLSRIKQYDPSLLAVITVTEELALAQARKMDEELAVGKYRGPLHGIPYGIKDLFAVQGYPTTWGSKPYEHQVLDYNATVVTKLEEAGAVLVAKLTSGALARGDVWFGGQTKNPWDTTQGASGSSAGVGSAVAAGLVPFGIGTETLGSIVSPSSRCGVTGLRPTFGRVSRNGCMSLSWSMDKPGPIAKTAMDCAIVLEAIMGPDNLDLTVDDVQLQHPAVLSVKSLRVGYLKGMMENDSTELGKNAIGLLNRLMEAGYEMQEVELPAEDSIPYSAFDVILRAEAGAFFDELVRSHEVDKMVEQTGGSRANSLRQSRFIPAVEYLQANRHRQVLMDKMDETMAEIDILIAPTFGRQLLITNLTGHPALAFPTGFDDKSRPTSLTLVGHLFEEEELVAFGSEIQALTDFHLQHPPMFK
ncbi:amidase [uncultured Imperialibacter sp.]|uniref:amidase n=1 Tax=uncultured Imperialibacter sp. TaxID=1672639 RepID=UPI0030DD63B5|tara:strand:- start:1357 stop:3012 length:1656 start_codon:yes stop_codon:yes gene_type:complete